MYAYVETTDSPAGPISFAVDEGGGLVRLAFLGRTYPSSLEEQLQRSGFQVTEDGRRTAPARAELQEYNAGMRQRFDLLLGMIGTDWQRAVWQALLRIPFGQTRTYAQVAEMIGHPTAARAVGRANATNPLPLVVPCHRVIGTNGSLTGFCRRHTSQ